MPRRRSCAASPSSVRAAGLAEPNINPNLDLKPKLACCSLARSLLAFVEYGARHSIQHAKLGAGMLPGAAAPPAPAGYHNVVIVPGLTAVLPDGYALPAYIVAAAAGAGLACAALTPQYLDST